MLKRFCIAFIFVAAGGLIAARAQPTALLPQARPRMLRRQFHARLPIVHRKPTAASRKRAALSLVPAP